MRRDLEEIAADLQDHYTLKWEVVPQLKKELWALRWQNFWSNIHAASTLQYLPAPLLTKFNSFLREQEKWELIRREGARYKDLR